ncbi:NAD-dependent malic enzyme [Zavarzinia sp.]|uniref:NAD-dependent malic enzyme n=1 Tax=Zavarzinia sp. TaxID=2027920 RepID=UPI003BB6E1E3
MTKASVPGGIPTGMDLMQNPRLNKGTAFTEEEREAFGLVGLMPEGIDTEENRLKRIMLQLAKKSTDMGRYIFLQSLADNDRTLFYKTIMSDPVRFMPIVYTPTVGAACQTYGHIMRRPKGIYLGINRKGRIAEILRHWPEKDIRFIVVTDGERILGLGDLGTNGMGIPIGKLNLYTACAGVPPRMTLPVMIDVGTNNESLLRDPLYMGLKQSRVRGKDYDEFLEEFVQAVQEVFPRCCIQFEDFANVNAVPLLERYRNRVCCFNDDIQGTAGVAVAGVLAALKITGKPLTEQRFLFLGAGSAGTGIANLLSQVMHQAGLTLEEARARCHLFDIEGLVVESRNDLASFQRPFAHKGEQLRSFVEAIETLKPTGIIGVSAVAKAFTQEVIEAMARLNERPIVFPYSNPTSHAECTAEEAYKWSEGRAIFASGSPFPPVRIGEKTLVPGQGNNVYIFPAVGLAVYATEASRVTDGMFITAARAVAEQVTQADLDAGLIYPPLSGILEASVKVAVKVAAEIFKEGQARVPEPEDIELYIRSRMWKATYKQLL